MIDTNDYIPPPTVEEMIKKYEAAAELNYHCRGATGWHRDDPRYRGRPVVAVGQRLIYASQDIAAAAVGVSAASVRRAAKDGRMAGGYQWRYVTDELRIWLQDNPTKVTPAEKPVPPDHPNTHRMQAVVVTFRGKVTRYESVTAAARRFRLPINTAFYCLKVGKDRAGRRWERVGDVAAARAELRKFCPDLWNVKLMRQKREAAKCG